MYIFQTSHKFPWALASLLTLKTCKRETMSTLSVMSEQTQSLTSLFGCIMKVRERGSFGVVYLQLLFYKIMVYHMYSIYLLAYHFHNNHMFSLLSCINGNNSIGNISERIQKMCSFNQGI